MKLIARTVNDGNFEGEELIETLQKFSSHLKPSEV
jgi:hypothetical protein